MTVELRHLGVMVLVAGLFAAGCDDGTTEPGGDAMVPDSDGMGGMGGGMGGMGGEPDMDIDTGMTCDCPRGVCDADGVCVDASPCADDTECLEGNVCEGGACVAGCVDDVGCALADPNTPLCLDGRCGNCRDDDDCFGTGACVDNVCAEPDPCVDSRECNGERICIDGACGDRPGCDGDFTCPGGWSCLPSGDCAPSRTGACDADDDCGLGQVCLPGNPRVCAACRTDEHCPGNQLCAAGPTGNRCTEAGECQTDDDCVGARICDAGLCAAPACADDGDEPNDSPETATPIAAGLTRGRVSCNPDYFGFELPADTAAEIVLRQEDRAADLTLVVLGQNGMEFARSESPEPNEAVVVGPFATARPLVVGVEQAGPASTAAYNLEVRLFADGDRCVDDRYDVGGSDDDRESGRRVRAPGDAAFTGDLSGRICPEDDDVFCFHINTREELTARVEVLTGDAVIVGEVSNPTDEVIGNGSWSRGGPSTDIVARGPAGTWCLRLASENGGAGTYRVSLTAVSPDTQALCRNAEILPLDGGAVTINDRLGAASVASASCVSGGANADGGEIVYTLTVDDPAVAGCAQNPCLYPPLLLTARVEGLAGGTLGDPVVSIRRTCADSGSEVACADDTQDPRDPQSPQLNPAVVRLPVTEPGEYTIIVDGLAIGDRPDYRLQVDAAPLAAPPPNDTCAQAPPLDLVGGVAEVTVNLGRATDDYAACAGQGGPDVAYAVRLDRTSYVRVQALAQPNDFAVAAYLVADCGAIAPVRCGYGFEGEVPPGDYFLVIDGVDANARGRVTAQMVVEPYGNAPANETCAAAQRLDAAGGQLQGDTRPAGDDYRLVEGNPCTGHNTNGGDVVYQLPRQAVGRYFIEASPDGGWDLALAVVNGCADPAGERRACSDGGLTEAVVFDAPGSELFVIVDGTNNERGRFTLRWGPAECAGDFDCAAGEACVGYACVAAP